jgi:hypothetical protein
VTEGQICYNKVATDLRAELRNCEAFQKLSEWSKKNPSEAPVKIQINVTNGDEKREFLEAHLAETYDRLMKSLQETHEARMELIEANGTIKRFLQIEARLSEEAAQLRTEICESGKKVASTIAAMMEVTSTLKKEKDEALEDLQEAKYVGLCSICVTNPKQIAAWPCRHLACCKECYERIRGPNPFYYGEEDAEDDGRNRCPVCRAIMQEGIEVYLP